MVDERWPNREQYLAEALGFGPDQINKLLNPRERISRTKPGRGHGEPGRVSSKSEITGHGQTAPGANRQTGDNGNGWFWLMG